jgi:uncharacterized protein
VKNIAVVTGASSGIGAATAERLAKDKWTVALLARGAGQLAEVAARVTAAGGEALVFAVDAGDPDALREVAAKVRAHGAPRLLVNCAGAGVWRRLDRTSPDEARIMLAAPFLAAFHTTHAFLGDMIAAGEGAIVHVGSPASHIPWPGATGYIATRWALRGLHEALEQDLRGTGVRSLHVVFGKVTSEYFAKNPDSEQYIPGVGKLIRVISPEEAARVIVEASEDDSGEIAYPFMLKMFFLADRFFPGITRWLSYTTSTAR